MADHGLITLAIRAILFLLLLLALACTGSGAGVKCKNFKSSNIAIGKWKDPMYNSSKLKGQYFVFIMELLFMFVAPALFAYRFLYGVDRNKLVDLCACGLGTLIMFICACVEAWYASGYDFLPCTVQAWGAATFFLFIATGLFGADTVLTFMGS